MYPYNDQNGNQQGQGKGSYRQSSPGQNFSNCPNPMAHYNQNLYPFGQNYNYYASNYSQIRPPFQPHAAPVEPQPPHPDCICDRPKKVVACMGCDLIRNGFRVRKTCPVHPNRITLSDLAKCPICRSSTIVEFD